MGADVIDRKANGLGPDAWKLTNGGLPVDVLVGCALIPVDGDTNVLDFKVYGPPVPLAFQQQMLELLHESLGKALENGRRFIASQGGGSSR